MLEKRINRIAPPGTAIPKPNARKPFRVKGNGIRRGSRALIYTIPNHNEPNSPYEKGIAYTEFDRCYHRLKQTGQLTRSWFKRSLSNCEAEGPCNFTTVGGIFELLGVAYYDARRPGVYFEK